MFYYYKTKKYLFNILRKLLYKKVFKKHTIQQFENHTNRNRDKILHLNQVIKYSFQWIMRHMIWILLTSKMEFICKILDRFTMGLSWLSKPSKPSYFQNYHLKTIESIQIRYLPTYGESWNSRKSSNHACHRIHKLSILDNSRISLFKPVQPCNLQ